MRYEGKPKDGKLTDATGVDLQRNSELIRKHADVTVVSFPKSGRTWLSYMVTGYIGKYLGRPEISQHIVDGRLRTLVPERLTGYINGVLELRTPSRWAPLVLFEHKVKLSRPFNKRPYPPAPTTPRNFLLVRDPRDVIISFFHHVIDLYKGKIPGTGGEYTDETTLPAFIRSNRLGMPQLTSYLVHWANWASETGSTILFYEDIARDPRGALSSFLAEIGVSEVDAALVDEVIEETAFDRMKAAEIAAQRGRDDPSKRRMRGGKVGGFRTELSQEDVDYVNKTLESTMTGPLERYRLK